MRVINVKSKQKLITFPFAFFFISIFWHFEFGFVSFSRKYNYTICEEIKRRNFIVVPIYRDKAQIRFFIMLPIIYVWLEWFRFDDFFVVIKDRCVNHHHHKCCRFKF